MLFKLFQSTEKYTMLSNYFQKSKVTLFQSLTKIALRKKPIVQFHLRVKMTNPKLNIKNT